MYSSPKVLNFHHVRLVVQQSIRMALLVATMARSGSARARACLEMQNLTRSMSQLDLPNFLSCPLEILWKIFLELVPDAQAIRTCRLVCRTFLQGIDSSLQLRIFLKCDAWGYRQPSFRKDGRSLNLSEFSEKLDAHVRSWVIWIGRSRMFGFLLLAPPTLYLKEFLLLFPFTRSYHQSLASLFHLVSWVRRLLFIR